MSRLVIRDSVGDGQGQSWSVFEAASSAIRTAQSIPRSSLDSAHDEDSVKSTGNASTINIL